MTLLHCETDWLDVILHTTFNYKIINEIFNVRVVEIIKEMVVEKYKERVTEKLDKRMAEKLDGEKVWEYC